MSSEVRQWIEDQLKWHQEWKPTYGDTEIDIARNEAKIDVLQDLLRSFPQE